MKSRFLKTVLFFIAEALAEAALITLLTALCSGALARLRPDLTGVVRGAGILIVILVGDGVAARATGIGGAPRVALDAAVLAAALALTFILLTYTPVSGLFA